MNRWKHPDKTGLSSSAPRGAGLPALLLILCFLLPCRAGAQTEVKLTADQKVKLDTFFSNFSESDFKSFKQNSLSQEALLKFALDHIYKNDYKNIRHSGNWAYIPTRLVDLVTEKYFGQKLKKHEKSEYRVPEATGENQSFSQITKLTQAGSDLYRAQGLIYMTGSGGTPDPHGTPEAWKKAGEEVERIGKFTALLKRVQGRCILLEYQVVDKS